MTDPRIPDGDEAVSPEDHTPEDRSPLHDGPEPQEDARCAGFLHGHMPSLDLGRRLSGPLARCVIVSAITLFLLFPLSLVGDLVYDRAHLYMDATENITSSWGKTQTISGPALIIPYKVWKDHKELVEVRVNGKMEVREWVTREYSLRHKVILPSDLTFATEIDPEIRYRGIYRQALYNAPVNISGTFVLPHEKEFAQNAHEIQWDKAWLCVGMTDLKTISQPVSAEWAGTALPAHNSGTNAGDILGAGFHTPVPLVKTDAGEARGFSIALRVRGSGGFYFTPVGENTVITMNGTWPAPSFQGNLLPVERTVTDQGFSARWAIPNLTRTYPQTADLEDEKSGMHSIDTFTAGVDLHEPVTLYRMVRRSVTYGILFIAATFVALFAFEMAARQRMHLVQYAMVGLSMSLFYLVLLSLAEHVAFGLAFVAASAVTVAMNSLYVGAALRSRNKGFVMGGLLTGLYAVLFSLLRMEEFSLVMGTGLVLAMMGALMYVTRNLPVAGQAGEE